MPRYKYVALDASGAESEGVLDAESQSQAITMIRSRGYFPTRIMEIGVAAQRRGVTVAARKGPSWGLTAKLARLFRRGVRPKHLVPFTRQLATLVDAGLPLLRGLRIIAKQEKNPVLKDAIEGLSESVEGGSTFSEALALYPRIFDNLFVNMVRAGEAGGVLELVLRRLADFMEKAERVKRKVRGAMIYPTVVLVIAMGITSFLLVKVIPGFAKIFEELLEGEHKQLPPLTQFVINVSSFFAHQWYVIAVLIASVVVLVKIADRTEKGSYALDKLKLRLPLFGILFTKAGVARFARTLGTLMTSGVPVLQALNIVKETAGNDVISRAISHVHDSVKEGENMALPLEASGVFPDMVVSMVDVGEETGALPDMLMKIADNYDEEVDAAVEGLTAVIEPLMIIILAFIIGTIVIAMFVPLITIITEMATQ